MVRNLVNSTGGKGSFIHFQLSIWGAKKIMPCGVQIVNFPTEETYYDFFTR